MQHLGPQSIAAALPAFTSSRAVIAQLQPHEPVYCFHRHIAQRDAREFLSGFPGDVLYAVKANPSLPLLDALYEAGVRHFDTASLSEIKRVKERFPDARCYFMAPVRFIGASKEAFHKYGVTDFVLDSDEELEKIISETGSRDLTLYVRLKADVGGALLELSSKFGVYETDAARLLKRIAELGCRPALAFHVGSLCLDAEAFSRAIDICRNVLALAEVKIAGLDVGGGFPAPYPGANAPPLSDFFESIEFAAKTINLDPDTRLLCEPGRGLAANSMSLVTNVIGRHGDRVFINDGIYGSFDEMTVPNSRIIYPTRAYRMADGVVQELTDPQHAFTIYGPTCDSLDVLPHQIDLPSGIRLGDYIEFGLIGAYSYANRTEFNGFFPDRIVEISDPAVLPPGLAETD
jgi:ornithine decarboxylase